MLKEKLKYAIHFCKSIDTDDYARVALSAAPPAAITTDDESDDVQSLESDELCPSVTST